MTGKKPRPAQLILACPKCGATGNYLCGCNVLRVVMTKAKAAELAVIEFARRMGL